MGMHTSGVHRAGDCRRVAACTAALRSVSTILQPPAAAPEARPARANWRAPFAGRRPTVRSPWLPASAARRGREARHLNNIDGGGTSENEARS
jgi:hypothetical protein